MNILYTGSSASEMHDVMTRPPRFTSLDRYYLGLDDHFNVVPIGMRATVCLDGQSIANASRKGRRHQTKGVASIIVGKLKIRY